MLRWTFYSNREWESDSPRRVADGGGADLIILVHMESDSTSCITN
jgi:hypothetical protein